MEYDMKRILIIAISLIAFSPAFSQDRFSKFDFLIGGWQGMETGIAGDGIGFRTYDYELNNNYIVQHNQSSFPKTEKQPMGEVHRDFSIISFNSNDSSIILREFHVEGFTNIYLLDKELSNGSSFVFLTREIENNPGNWKARLTINKISDTEFNESFDIATDGVNFKNLLKNRWKKVE
jgi:hypothetical protein